MGQVLAFAVLSTAALGTIMAIAVSVLGDAASAWLFDAKVGGSLLLLSVVGSIAFSLNAVLSGALVGISRFKALAVWQALAASGSIILAGALAGAAGASGAMVGYVAAQLLVCLLMLPFVARALVKAGGEITMRGLLSEWRILPSAGVPLMLGSLVIAPVWLACQAFLLRRADGLEQAAIFSIAFSWMGVAMMVPSFVTGPMLPRMVQIASPRQWNRVLRLSTAALAAVGALSAAAIAIISPWVMRAHGQEYVAGTEVLQVLCLASAVTWIAGGADVAIMARGNLWVGFALNALWGVFMVAVASELAVSEGALGLAFAALAAYGLKSVSQVLYVMHSIRIGRS